MGNPARVFQTRDHGQPDWRNVVAVYDGTSELERADGRAWYQDAWNLASALAEKHWHSGSQRKAGQAAGILAALAQNTGWDRNVQLATQTFAARGFLARGTFPLVREKCTRIYQGENPRKVLGGDKIKAFYECIVAKGRTNTICVDRHAFHVAMGRVVTDRERQRYLGRKLGYALTSQAFLTALEYINLRDSEELAGAQLQAICWVAWRNELLGENRGFRAPEPDQALAS